MARTSLATPAPDQSRRAGGKFGQAISYWRGPKGHPSHRRRFRTIPHAHCCVISVLPWSGYGSRVEASAKRGKASLPPNCPALHQNAQKEKVPRAEPSRASNCSARGDGEATAASNCQFLGVITASIA